MDIEKLDKISKDIAAAQIRINNNDNIPQAEKEIEDLLDAEPLGLEELIYIDGKIMDLLDLT